MSLLTIGKIAKQTSVSVQTLRYYERRGVLKPDAKRDSGYRLYSEDAVKVVRFIKHAQELGFSLDEIYELLKLKADRVSKCENVQSRALKHVADVKEKISRLVRIKKILDDLVLQCRKRKTNAECPLLACLDAQGVTK